MSESPPVSRRILFAKFILSVSLGCSVALSAFAVARKTPSIVVPILFLAAAAAPWVLIGRSAKSERLVGVIMLAATLNFVVCIPEMGLRLMEFRHEYGIQFGAPRPERFRRFVPDEDLFWTLPPSRPDINSMGFPDDEVVIPKPADVFRIAFLGDSCTVAEYPDIVELLLNEDSPDGAKRVECITLAVSGYSSHQGRVLAEKYGDKLEPDMVVVYFGWNDHWQAYGAVDADKVVNAVDVDSGQLTKVIYRNVRLLQFVRSIVDSFSSGKSNGLLDEVRVPADHYRENLKRIGELFDPAQTTVAFITAPTSHYALGMPDYLVQMDFTPDKETGTRRHRRYNEIVREQAAALGAQLIDLEADMARRSNLEELFVGDGIHFTRKGLILVAKRVADTLKPHVPASELSN